MCLVLVRVPPLTAPAKEAAVWVSVLGLGFGESGEKTRRGRSQPFQSPPPCQFLVGGTPKLLALLLRFASASKVPAPMQHPYQGIPMLLWRRLPASWWAAGFITSLFFPPNSLVCLGACAVSVVPYVPPTPFPPLLQLAPRCGLPSAPSPPWLSTAARVVWTGP